MKKLLYTIILLTSILYSYAQNNHINKRLNLKFAYNHFPWMGDITYTSFLKSKTFTPTGKIECNYGINSFIETGGYIGFSMYERGDLSGLEQSYEGTWEGGSTIPVNTNLKPMVTYGIVTNLQLIPLIFNPQHCFIDLYLSAKIGGIYFSDRNKSYLMRERSMIDYGIYGGLAIHPFKYWGIFGEYGFGNYTKWKAGLSINF